jgi:hypothetical protein
MATIFDESAFWLVRQAILIVAFFRGLRMTECHDLLLEKMVRNNDIYKITHSRCKQHSDQRATAFHVPAQGRFAAQALANTWKRSTGQPAGYGGPRPMAVKIGAYLNALNPSIFKRSFYVFNRIQKCAKIGSLSSCKICPQ